MKQAKVLTDKELKKVIGYIDAFDRHAERNRAIVRRLCKFLCKYFVSTLTFINQYVSLPSLLPLYSAWWF
jgi:bacteriocin-like protein